MIHFILIEFFSAVFKQNAGFFDKNTEFSLKKIFALAHEH